jgi:hypothetical protein
MAIISHRLNKRVQPPTEIGTNTRMLWTSYRKTVVSGNRVTNLSRNRERPEPAVTACEFPQ